MPRQSNGKNHLVVGCFGQVGSAIEKVLSKAYEVDGIDKKSDPIVDKRYDYLHVCIPFFSGFVQQVKKYARKFLKPNGIIVIHSTVAVGTTAKLGPNAVHSPVRGVHPNLAAGVATFTKYFAGARSLEAALPFSELDIYTKVHPDARTTEAMKLWDTLYYGWNIIFEKAVFDFCRKNELPFDLVYKDANKSYNDGYKALGMDNVQRPVLNHVEGEIGGHCVVPNAKILGGDFARFLISKNKTYKGGS